MILNVSFLKDFKVNFLMSCDAVRLCFISRSQSLLMESVGSHLTAFICEWSDKNEKPLTISFASKVGVAQVMYSVKWVAKSVKK